ncbi:DUF1674 domain-containing protein [Coralloluteibacterium thermophilus]|uniref:DUF1674 domain-containing protein n=1 Tax=Coralloluteibacterium thermophilum TaxID=2707049 RepID=A0ABV9NLV2_9GAMM
MISETPNPAGDAPENQGDDVGGTEREKAAPVEIGGRGGPDPTRYGDWEKNGRCVDF